MYKLGGILFCLLAGVLVGKYGLIALLWTPLGFIIGIFATSNIVLPILMGVPIAISFVVKKQMRPNVFFALGRTPIIWLVVLFLLGWFFPTATSWLYNNEPLNIAGNLGFLLILFSPLSKKVRGDFREDFDKAFGKYYTNYVDSKTELKDLASLTDTKKSKQVEAGIKVFSNLYTHTTNKDDDSKYTLVPDAKYRYMIFCMSSFINCCEDIIYERESFIGDCISFLSVFMTSRENAKEFFSGEADINVVKQRTPSLLKEYLNNWASYNNALKKNDMNLANSILCVMMHSTMSNEPLIEADRKGLEEIASSITETLPAMRSAFIKLR